MIYFWIVLNVTLSVMLGAVICYKLMIFSDMLYLGERLGLGMAGGAVILSIAVLLDVHHYITPFSNWYQTLWRSGWLLFIGSRVVRDVHHRRANKQAEAAARERMAARTAPAD